MWLWPSSVAATPSQLDLLQDTRLLEVGGGTLAGVAVGYAAKRAAKWALLLLGLILIGLYFLAQQGWVTVQWQAVSQELEEGSKGLGQWFKTMVVQLSPSLVGFGAGLVMGFKIR